MPVEPIDWSNEDRTLWSRITAHDFERAGDALTFTARFARDHGWAVSRSRRIVDEYRRFCFLAVRGGREVTPSEIIDEVWHQHLTYSRDYWKVWCRNVLRRDLHHGPTKGGLTEAKRFAEQYADTLAVYEAWFGSPPSDLWPGTAERFDGQRFRVVDCTTHLVVPFPCRRFVRWRRFAHALCLGMVLAIVSARPASAAALNVLNWTALPFLMFYVAAAGLSVGAALILPPLLLDNEVRPIGRSRLTPVELGLLAGGTARAADVLILEDIAAQRVALQAKVRRLGPLTSRTDILTVGEQSVTRAWLTSKKSDTIADLRHKLVEEGLLLSTDERQAFRRAVLLLLSPIVLLGLAKVVVGLQRGKPVGILTSLFVVTAIATVVLAERRSLTSQAGRRLIEDQEAKHSRALRAPRPEEVIGAFAIMGDAVLAGTAFEAYGRMLKSEAGGGCGGDGGGGGGCGGCGG